MPPPIKSIPLPSTIPGVSPADTGDSFVAGDTVQVAEGPLNLRSSAGTSASSIGSLPVGTQLSIVSGPTAANGYNWYQVKTSTGQTGWVIVDALELVPNANADFGAGDQVVVFDGPVNLRSSAGTSASIVKSLPQDTLLTIVAGPSAANEYAWYQVQTADSVTGWVAADFIEAVDTPNPPANGDFTVGDRAVVTDGPVNLRSAAGTSNSSVAVLQTGDTMNITGGPTATDGYSWYQVSTTAGSTGWIASDFIGKSGFANGDVVYVNTDSLNVRSAAGLSSTVLDTVYQGTTAVITGGPTTADSRDWYKIDVSGVVSGWVAGEYLSASDAPPVTPPTGLFGSGDWIFVNDPPRTCVTPQAPAGRFSPRFPMGTGCWC